MGSSTEQSLFLGHPLNTLAQSGTTQTDHAYYPTEKLVFGKGSDLTDAQALQVRAKRKAITNAIILQLIDVAKAKGHTERVQSYWNAYHCNSHVTTANGKLYTKYCKTRYCTLCLSIRKATIINRYLSTIEQWEQPYFVTLTVKAVPYQLLPKWMEAMKVAFTRIRQRCNKRHQRGKGIKLVGIKSLECNFNPSKQTYNPHYHIITANKEMATTLVVEWQKTWNAKTKLTSPFAQDMRAVYSNEGALVEIIKYGAKLFTEPDQKTNPNTNVPRQVYAAALDNIFAAMQNIRLFDRFGFNLPPSPSAKAVEQTFLQHSEDWQYMSALNDWVNVCSGEVLTGYDLPPQLRYLLASGMNTDLA